MQCFNVLIFHLFLMVEGQCEGPLSLGDRLFLMGDTWDGKSGGKRREILQLRMLGLDAVTQDYSMLSLYTVYKTS